MKLIQQRKLFFKEGKSDKVYEIDLCELSPSQYLVNFRYGRRGSALKEGTKTPAALSREQAEAIFSELESEKRSKGYQTETETFIELPSLDDTDIKTIKGAILHRLQDALAGTKSFKTEWKTSRVIWKAGVLQIEEAIPLILKLANKGDEMQLYCALWALTALKASPARALFTATASNSKQKKYIRNICWEGLLTVSEEDERSQLNARLLEQLPEELQSAIRTNDGVEVGARLAQMIQESSAEGLTVLYLLCKSLAWLQPLILERFRTVPFRPPYFRQIRAVYKLAQLRKDAAMVAVLSYRFEKEGAMFKRTGPLENDYKRFVPQIGQLVKVSAELKNEEGKLAFSQFTKEYFQKNALEYLRSTGAKSDAKAYLRLAIATLLQYSEADYSAGGERPQNEYGRYNYQTRLYQFTLVKYPECYDSLLLSAILFGNDSNRILEPSLKFVLSKRVVTGKSYYYSPNEPHATILSPAVNAARPATPPNPQSVAGSVLNSVGNALKSLFRKKQSSPVPQNSIPPTPNAPEATQPESPRTELFPAYWDSMPEAYVQLMMQARMDVIHRFALGNLQVHSAYEEICNRFDQQALLHLLNSGFELPGLFGFEVLRSREEEFAPVPGFVGRVLDCSTEQARQWAVSIVGRDPGMYLNDLEFILLLLFNARLGGSPWINDLLTKSGFPEERIQAVLGKTITELLHLPNTSDNNELAIKVISRLQLLAGAQMQRISWSIVGQLISSPLEANKILAGEILIKKSENIAPTEIPISLTTLFLQSETPEIRQKGILFLDRYPNEFLGGNLSFVLELADSPYQDVVNAGLSSIRKLLPGDPAAGNAAALHMASSLMRKEKFEIAHLMIGQFLSNELKPFRSTGLAPRDLTKLIHCQYRVGQLAGYDILKSYERLAELTLGQIISFGSHELLVIRQWCWNYFTKNPDRIREEKGKALNLLDSAWDDTRAFAFHFFGTEFKEADWDADTLISIVDSIRPDVESFGKELITKWFKEEHALHYLTRLSEHPGINVQGFVSRILSLYASDKPELFPKLDFYVRSVLTRVNKGRVAKDHIFSFLRQEAVKSEEAARWVASVADDIAVQETVEDRATCIDILSDIKNRYQHLDMHLVIKN